MINTTNLLALKTQIVNKPAEVNQTTAMKNKPAETNSGLLNAYLNNLALINTPAVKKSETVQSFNYHNNLKTLFNNNQ